MRRVVTDRDGSDDWTRPKVRVWSFKVGDSAIKPVDEWLPPLPSRDAELLERMPVSQSDTWASRALRAVLTNVGDDQYGVLINPIAVTDAWTDGAEAFCVVYTPPLGAHELVGVRRRRGDRHPDGQFTRYLDLRDFEALDTSVVRVMPDDPEEYALLVLDSIGDSLGVYGSHLRYDANGLGWWGTLDEQLPTRTAE